jgi:hypothetical protein
VFWQYVIGGIFEGVMAKVIASVLLFFSFYLGIMRRRLMAGAMMLIISAAITYLGGILKMIF